MFSSPKILTNNNRILGPSQIFGPAFYNIDANNESANMQLNNSFLSKAKRFSSNIKNTGPGPGAYYKTLNTNANPDALKSKVRMSPAFYKRQSKNRFTEDYKTPGPGVYNPKIKRKNVPAAKFVFDSGVERLYQRKNLTPGPGVYEIKRGFDERSKNRSKPNLERKNIENNEKKLIEEIKQWGKEQSQKESAPIWKREKSPKVRKPSVHKTIKPEENNKFSVPGPGSYLNLMRNFEKQAVSDAVFKSESERNRDKSGFSAKVGPGSYRTNLPLKKKNFHYNGKGNWV